MAGRTGRRIGLVIGQLSFGGAESQLYELARALRASADVTVYCLSERSEPYGALLDELGIPVRCLPALGSFDLSRVRRLRRALKADRVEIVHAFLFIASAYAYLATRLLRRVVLVTSARNLKPEPNPLRRSIVRRAFRASHAVICNSEAMRAYAVRHYGLRPSNSYVVYNGVDATRFRTSRATKRPITAGTIARLEVQKNLGLFIDAAAMVSAHRPDSTFAVVGEGSLRRQLQESIESRGLQHRLALRGPTSDVPAFFAELDQFWLTSDWEGTPNVLLEAMAAGVPVVATDVGATSELVEDGHTGFIVRAGDAGAVAEASLRMLADPELAERIATNARHQALSRYSIERMVADTQRVYAAALEGAG